MSQFGRKKKTTRLTGPKPVEEESIFDQKAVESADNAKPMAKLEDMPEEIRKAVKKAGWRKLMDVQARSIPYILKRQDLMVQSRTGSGKTGAFILPLLKRLDGRKAECQALVLTPTRELAQQVHQEAEMIFGDSGLKSMPIYGGVGYGAQLDGLKSGVQLVVGTPGRILDHLQRGTLKLEKLRVLILDEADRMLSMGFYPDIERIKRELPDGKGINTYLFSATFPPRVMGLSREFLHKPETLSLSRDHVHVTDIDHRFCVVRGLDKDRALVRLIEVENPDQALIFCNTKAQVEYLAETLKNFGYRAEGITSDLTQKNREKLLSQMKNNQIRFLVATDVASRGIDIPDLSHVFLYEVPEDHEDYIHRAGRTGRAGAAGTAISMTGLIEQLTLKRLARRYKIEMQKVEMPTEEDMQNLMTERLMVMLEAHQHGLDPLARERIARFADVAQSLSQDDHGKALLAMILDSFYMDAKARELTDIPEEDKIKDKPRPSQSSGRSGRGGRSSSRSRDRRPSGGDRDRRENKSRSDSDRPRRRRPPRSQSGNKSGAQTESK